MLKIKTTFQMNPTELGYHVLPTMGCLALPGQQHEIMSRDTPQKMGANRDLRGFARYEMEKAPVFLRAQPGGYHSSHTDCAPGNYWPRALVRYSGSKSLVTLPDTVYILRLRR